MERRKDYLNGLSRTKLQQLAKKCPGVKANWKSQTIRELLLDPQYDIRVPTSSATPASIDRSNALPPGMAESAPSNRSSVKRKQTESSVADRSSKRHCSASVHTPSVSVSPQPGLAVPPRHGRHHNRRESAASTTTPDAIITTSRRLTPLYDGPDGSIHDELSFIIENEEAAPEDHMQCEPRNATTLRDTPASNTEVQQLNDTHENATDRNINGKRPRRRTDDVDDQLRSRPRLRMGSPDIPSARKGKAKMTVEEQCADRWDQKVQFILGLIRRGRQDQSEVRARRLQEEMEQHKERIERIKRARNMLIDIIYNLGSDAPSVLRSAWDHVQARVRASMAAKTMTQLQRQVVKLGEPGTSARHMEYTQDDHQLYQAAVALTELFRMGYTARHILLALLSPE